MTPDPRGWETIIAGKTVQLPPAVADAWFNAPKSERAAILERWQAKRNRRKAQSLTTRQPVMCRPEVHV